MSAATLCDSALKKQDELHWVKAEGSAYSLKTSFVGLLLLSLAFFFANQ